MTMRCPWCNHEEDRVLDSRSADGGTAIRRRRECRGCRRRYTTFERVEEVGLTVVKRDGAKEAYDRDKVLAGLHKALTNRPPTEEQVAALADRVGERVHRKGPEVSSQEVGIQVLAGLKKLDHVAYMRFASVYKDFQDMDDFERELGVLLRKRAPVKGTGS
jgi:transcriptional repressor NrdR